MPPLISIVTPSLNQAPYLERAIGSVLDQDYPSFEYFVVDGGSTDGSVEIVRRHEARLAGWTSEPDKGQADALARGFARCKGEILAYINSDDYYLPGALAAAAAAFSRHPESQLIYGDAVFVDPAGRAFALDVLPAFDWEDLRRVCVIPQQAAFWRRSAYEAVGGIDASFQFSLDYDLFLRIASRGRAVHVPRLMAAFRHHPEAKTSRSRERWAREDALLRSRWLGREGWTRGDWLRMKWLSARQIGCIAARRLRGERFPTLAPARWERLLRRRKRALHLTTS